MLPFGLKGHTPSNLFIGVIAVTQQANLICCWHKVLLQQPMKTLSNKNSTNENPLKLKLSMKSINCVTLFYFFNCNFGRHILAKRNFDPLIFYFFWYKRGPEALILLFLIFGETITLFIFFLLYKHLFSFLNYK